MSPDLLNMINDWKNGPVFTVGFHSDHYDDNHMALTNLYYMDDYEQGYQHGFKDSTANMIKEMIIPGSLLLTHANMKRVDKRRPILAVDEVISDPQWWDMYFVDGTYHGQFWSFYVDRIAHSPWGVGGFFSEILDHFDLKQTDDYPFTSVDQFEKSPMNKGKMQLVVPKS